MISKKTEIPDRPNTDKTNRTIQIELFPTITKGDVRVIANVLKDQKLEIVLLNSSGEVLQTVLLRKSLLILGLSLFTF